MSSQQSWAAMRTLVARRDGYRCCYCGVPTAATIEHLEARSEGGEHFAHNLRLACPHCNRKKGAMPLEKFLASGAQRLEVPDLPDAATMLADAFGLTEGFLPSGSTNARLELSNGDVFAQVRAHRGDRWRRVRFGPSSSPAVARAAWEFLRRHDTRGLPGGEAQS